MSEYTLNDVVNDDFETMKSMLDSIRDKMKTHINPVDKIEYIKPIKMMIFEAWSDICEHGKPTFEQHT